ncbi:GntR family transcriptional regulator [Palleronia caenipelagi]|uniref:FCD domain-containing protein n=1 Tax=Palleronia caenipelagi TaxID=2489174 RepID=A0A547PQ27_9RHOB|nr:FCD domain-containing protein [Palleronia caenipelagi]TRD16251.1 FCD domain-containing protein [Palleronia caenipelagi]
MDEPARTIGASTYQRIKQDIISGALTPGRKLKLTDLKERYDTSPSTLREALSRLVSAGFVEAPEQRGFLVAPVSPEDLTEIAELRVLLETHALTLSIQNGDTEWEGDLVAAYHKLRLMEQKMLSGDESEKVQWKRYDWEFHETLIRACKSSNLLALHARLYEKYLRYQMLVLTYRGEDAAEEHRKMFEAALARDTATAAAVLEAHVLNGLQHTLAAMGAQS